MILYLTYDGLSDPLGQSQILPYLENLASSKYPIHILSCEKKEKLIIQNEMLLVRINKNPNLSWDHVNYHPNPKIFSTLYDLHLLKNKAIKYIQKNTIKIVHCRSYPTATIGLSLKKKFGLKFIFDMRGFYMDERFDGGIWNKKNIIWRALYPKLKKLESNLINGADTVVSLTEEGKTEILKWKSIHQKNIVVTPCAVDMNHFDFEYNLEPKTVKLVYLGSIGTWYMLDEMLNFFVRLKVKFPASEFHFITTDEPEKIISSAKKKNILLDDLKIYPSTRKQLPNLLSSMDLSIFFIKPSYSKKASSPTKLGELLSMGIPVICNKNVGDLNQQSQTNEDHILAIELEQSAYDAVIKKIPHLLHIRKTQQPEVRATAKKYFSLEDGVKNYAQIYAELNNLN